MTGPSSSSRHLLPDADRLRPRRRGGRLPAAPRLRSVAGDGRAHRRRPAQLPGRPAGGVAMDLAAINIQRGRDLGLGTLNETREALGLREYTRFEQITDDRGDGEALQAGVRQRRQRGPVDRRPRRSGTPGGAMLGETFQTIIADQFEALRDGDRYWYQGVGFDRATLRLIEQHLAQRHHRAQHRHRLSSRTTPSSTTAGTPAALGGVASDDPSAPQLVIGSRRRRPADRRAARRHPAAGGGRAPDADRRRRARPVHLPPSGGIDATHHRLLHPPGQDRVRHRATTAPPACGRRCAACRWTMCAATRSSTSWATTSCVEDVRPSDLGFDDFPDGLEPDGAGRH